MMTIRLRCGQVMMRAPCHPYLVTLMPAPNEWHMLLLHLLFLHRILHLILTGLMIQYIIQIVIIILPSSPSPAISFSELYPRLLGHLGLLLFVLLHLFPCFVYLALYCFDLGLFNGMLLLQLPCLHGCFIVSRLYSFLLGLLLARVLGPDSL